MLFRNRSEAGRWLADRLQAYAQRPDVLVLGLPRGGIPVAFEVARDLGAPLDVFVVRKLGVPGQEELAMGAIATGGVRVVNQDVVDALAHPARRAGPGGGGGGPRAGAAGAVVSRASGRRRTSRARPSSSSTTGWPPAPRCARRWRRCGSRARRGSSSPCPWPPPPPARSWRAKWTRSSASPPRSRSWPWAASTTTSRRPRDDEVQGAAGGGAGGHRPRDRRCRRRIPRMR